ncbi:MAG: hypothetical protein AB7K86_03075 [Rhodospirillales bacterium]
MHLSTRYPIAIATALWLGAAAAAAQTPPPAAASTEVELLRTELAALRQEVQSLRQRLEAVERQLAQRSLGPERLQPLLSPPPITQSPPLR